MTVKYLHNKCCEIKNNEEIVFPTQEQQKLSAWYDL